VGDPSMGRGTPEQRRAATHVRRASRIGSGAIVVPPCEIGEEAVVGAGSLVRGDVPARTVVAGTPAVPIREVAEHELLR
jgi:acetyltransferase-like isoleucine patch superfamily enzyme